MLSTFTLPLLFAASLSHVPCALPSGKLASFSDPSIPASFSDVVNVLYVSQQLVSDEQLVSRIRVCADMDNDGEIGFNDFVNTMYVSLGSASLPTHLTASPPPLPPSPPLPPHVPGVLPVSDLVPIRSKLFEVTPDRVVAPVEQRQGSVDVLRVAIVGLGRRGMAHYIHLAGMSGVEVVALCDINPSVHEQSSPPRYGQRGDLDYRRMYDDRKPHMVVIATPWEWHSLMAIDAMARGIYVACEVQPAMSVEEMWALVDAHETTGTHFSFMENVLYRSDVMALYRAIRDNFFGKVVSLTGAYTHDLRNEYLQDGVFGERTYEPNEWRSVHHEKRNADLYPTHGLGPVQYMANITRGDRFVSLVSMGSVTPGRGLNDFLQSRYPDSKYVNHRFEQADIVHTLLKTERGVSVLLTYDTTLPAGYTLDIGVRGTRARYDDSRTLGGDPLVVSDHSSTMYGRYRHPFESQSGGGHGGMDGTMWWDILRRARANARPACDVYDAATMMAVSPLSQQSIFEGRVVPFPDFTRGKYVQREGENDPFFSASL